MSSAEDSSDPTQSVSRAVKKKRQQTQKACDRCRQKKVRCDGMDQPDHHCSNCTLFNTDCTYLYVKSEFEKRRVAKAPKKDKPVVDAEIMQGYVDGLVARIQSMEGLLKKAFPDTDIDAALDVHTVTTSREPHKISLEMTTMPGATQAEPFSHPRPIDRLPFTGTSVPIEDRDPEPSDDEYEYGMSPQILEKLEALSLYPLRNLWLGKSSDARLLQRAVDMKSNYSGDRPERDNLDPLSSTAKAFKQYPWEHIGDDDRHYPYHFPEDDLLHDLVNAYFDRINKFLPLLHRPTFERSIADAQHLTDAQFGKILLLVCAVGAKYLDDPRVVLERESDWYSAGYKWFSQVEMVQRSVVSIPSLYDLQIHAITVLYLYGSQSQAAWVTAGVGLHLAVDVGAHRKRAYKAEPSVRDELWKRAFWVLMFEDVALSSFLGRPCGILEEEYDLDFPTECDDEFWETSDPSKAFKQPPGVPSSVISFTLALRLTQIHARTLRTIYQTNKSKSLYGFYGPHWEQRAVSEFDSDLNKWLESIPSHLQWDPTQNDAHAESSAYLRCVYHDAQIQLHRPFIRPKCTDSPLASTSLAICTNAARSSIRVIVAERQRTRRTVGPLLQASAFVSGVVLAINVLGMRRANPTVDPISELITAHTSVQILQEAEVRWHDAGRMRDVLAELINCADQDQDTLSLPSAGDLAPSQKVPTISLEPSPSASTRGKFPTRGSLNPRELRPLPNWSGLEPLHALIVHPPGMSQTSPYHAENADALHSGYSDLSSMFARDTPHDAAWDSFLSSTPIAEEQALALAPTTNAFNFVPPFLSDPTLPESSVSGASQQPSAPAHIAADFTTPMASHSRLTFDELMQANDDMLATWNGVPASFGLDQWDAYFRHMHDPPDAQS